MTRVMIVEDTRPLLEGIAFELEMRGYEVLTATDGLVALGVLEKLNKAQLPDVIVSDIAMPNMDGYQLFERVQANDDWQAIPFIFLTALASEKDIQQGKRLGVDDYLVKPFKPEELVIAIENKKRRFEQLRATNERKLDVVRQQLMSMISHELRTPLTAIYGGAELLGDDFAVDNGDISKQAVDLIQSGARRLNRLVNEVLWLVQFDSGHLQQTLDMLAQPHDLRQMMQVAQEVLSVEWPTERIVLYQNPEDTGLWVRGLRDVLVMIFMEAFHNALRFSKSNTPIDLVFQVEGDQVLIELTDYGSGIAPENIEKVWEPFVQSDRQIHEQQGMGLGLTLIREGVQLHGGNCKLYSELNKGTTLALQFPLITK
ncbi:MAG: hybrid sensor histidine kinase/response regulator [Chloroflexi bacterium]|nr:hybrid sensor histidine kinase/response regulator [Chloroflexota bacterium]